MPKATPTQRFRLQVTGLQAGTSIPDLIQRLKDEPALASHEISQPIRFYSTTTPGQRRSIVYLTVSGPALAEPLPQKLGMAQGRTLTTLWLVNKGDPGTPSPSTSRRTSPLASPRASPRTRPASPRFGLPPAALQQAGTPPATQSQSQSSDISLLAARGFHGSPCAPAPTTGRFQSLFPSKSRSRTPSPLPVSYIRTSSESSQAEHTSETPSFSHSPSWPSYIDPSPEYSANGMCSYAPTPTNTPSLTSPSQAQYIPWRDTAPSYADLPASEAVEHLSALLAGCVPYLNDPRAKTYAYQEERIGQAWKDEAFSSGMRRLSEALEKIRMPALA